MPKGVYNQHYSNSCCVCNNVFITQKVTAKYCSNTCRNVVWRINNREKYQQKQLNWIKNNPDRHLKNQRIYKSQRRAIDVQYRLMRNLRSRLGKIRFRDGVSHIDVLGCSISFLKEFIELKFTNGMNWDNYGKLWEVDHIIPFHSATNNEDIISLCHYSNLQPLSKEAHFVKTAKEKIYYKRYKIYPSSEVSILHSV